MKTQIKKLKIKSLGRWSFLLLFPLLISCLDEGDPIELPPVAHVSIYNASPDSPGLDLYVENTRINHQAVHYSNRINYTRFRTGERFFRFTPFNGFNTLHEASHTFEADKIYSLFITNTVTNMTTLLVEDNWSTPASGHAKLRSMHLSPDLGEVTIRMSREGTELEKTTTFEQINEFEEVEAGLYSIEVISPITGEILVSANNMELQDGRIYTVLIRGFQTPEGGATNGLTLQLLTNYNTL
ncbi:MAG TPA: DUF4397 domain-containing protein [Anditalea sp.]|nr:DUF4397 domain-containing protein [Anditalea sp.]